MQTLLSRAARLAIAGVALVAGADLGAQGKVPRAALSSKARAQIDTVRRAVARFADPHAAEDAGYQPVLGMVPLQGVHYVRPDLVRSGTFDLDEPSVLMYAPVKGEPKLVGVAYTFEHPRSQPLPEGFDGPHDDWHAHDELSPDPAEHIVMVHLWLTDSPGGPFARYNTWLPYMAASLERPSASELLAKNARGERARRFAFALAIATHPPQLFDLLESRGGPELTRAAYPHRRALSMAVDSLIDAERRGDKAMYDRLVTSSIGHSDALMAAYRGTVRSPRAREFIDKTLDELMGVGHEGHHSMPGTAPRAPREAHRHSPGN
jgi:hypothetical protein